MIKKLLSRKCPRKAETAEDAFIDTTMHMREETRKTNSPWCCIRKRWKQVLTCLQKGLGLLIWIIASGKRKASSIPLGQCAWRTFAPRGGKWQMLVAWPWIRLARLISARLHVFMSSCVLCPLSSWIPLYAVRSGFCCSCKATWKESWSNWPSQKKISSLIEENLECKYILVCQCDELSLVRVCTTFLILCETPRLELIRND